MHVTAALLHVQVHPLFVDHVWFLCLQGKLWLVTLIHVRLYFWYCQVLFPNGCCIPCISRLEFLLAHNDCDISVWLDTCYLLWLMIHLGFFYINGESLILKYVSF